MVLCVYMACVWVVLHVNSYVFLAWGIPRGGMNCPGHLNLWMKVLIHQQLPVWRWTAGLFMELMVLYVHIVLYVLIL